VCFAAKYSLNALESDEVTVELDVALEMGSA